MKQIELSAEYIPRPPHPHPGIVMKFDGMRAISYYREFDNTIHVQFDTDIEGNRFFCDRIIPNGLHFEDTVTYIKSLGPSAREELIAKYTQLHER